MTRWSEPLSAIVIAKDEETNIERCLASVAWVDEKVVIVDAASTDATARLARRYTPHVYEQPWLGYVGQKQFALEKTSHNWILWVDADEVVTPALIQEISETPPGVRRAFAVPRRHIFLNRWLRYGGAYPDYKIRLFDKRYTVFGNEAVHESMVVNGELGHLHAPLQHYSTPSLFDRVQKINRYTDLGKGASWSWREISWNPMRRFVLVYLQRQGFRDGVAGYVWAVCCGFEAFLEGAKSWESSMNARPYPAPMQDLP